MHTFLYPYVTLNFKSTRLLLVRQVYFVDDIVIDKEILEKCFVYKMLSRPKVNEKCQKTIIKKLD